MISQQALVPRLVSFELHVVVLTLTTTFHTANATPTLRTSYIPLTPVPCTSFSRMMGPCALNFDIEPEVCGCMNLST